MMTDPLSDMLTRIRNANRIERPAVKEVVSAGNIVSISKSPSRLPSAGRGIPRRSL